MAELFRFEAQHERKPGCIFKALAGLHTVKTDTIVKPKQTEHRQEEPHTHTHATTQAEWVIILIIIPAVRRLEEGQTIDRTSRVGHQRVAKFQLILIEYSKEA